MKSFIIIKNYFADNDIFTSITFDDFCPKLYHATYISYKMKLNLPIFEQLKDSKNILITGIGGGFDIYCGIPIYLTLKELGYHVHLANYSFSDITFIKEGEKLTDTLLGVKASIKNFLGYFPEFYLTQWFQKDRNEDIIIWTFQKTGTNPLLKNYQMLTKHLEIDTILMVDGGIDSLMRGNEAGMGTLLEDAVSMSAISQLTDIKCKILACIGFGAEQDVTHFHVFENIAALTKLGGFYGICALIPQMMVYQEYEKAVLYAQAQPAQDPSVINSSIVSAVRGEYDNYHLTKKTFGSKLWISPLMPIYWFFDFEKVADQNLFLPQIHPTETFWEAVQKYVLVSRYIAQKDEQKIPLL